MDQPEIPGIPVIAEAYGPSYQDYARVSMNTGLPTVIGWDYHVHQRAHDWPDINRRKEDVKRLYTTESEPAAREDPEDLPRRARLRRQARAARVRRRQPDPLPASGATCSPRVRERRRDDLRRAGPVHRRDPDADDRGRSPGAGRRRRRGGRGAPQVEQGQLTQPRGVDVDAAGNVYVADFGNDRIQEFDAQLQVRHAPGATRASCRGSSSSRATSRSARPATSTSPTRGTSASRCSSPTGEYLYEFGDALFGPRGIAVDRRRDASTSSTPATTACAASTPRASRTRTGAGWRQEPGQFKEPVGIAVDTEGNVYVCDNGNARVEIFSRRRQLQERIPRRRDGR